MHAEIVAEAPGSADQLRSLRSWLTGVEEFRGAVSLKESPPKPGTLGPVLDALVVALGPAGAATAFATTLITWLRSRQGAVRIKVTFPDRRSLEFTAKNITRMNAADIERQVALVTDMLRHREDGPERLEDS